MIDKIKMQIRSISKRLRAIFGYDSDLYERNILLQAKFLSVQRHKGRIELLREAEFRVFSQWGEDGIIDWLIACIPDINKSFVEFGVQNYRESNTRYMLMAHNWRGLVMDGSMTNIEDIRSQDIYWRHDILAKCAFIDCNNINSLLVDSGFHGEIGLISIDIDGNDYWVWQAIEVASPVIVVCEYNAVLGDHLSLTVPYDSNFYRTRAHHSNLYFGASIRALVKLGESKGYVFVGTASNGCNAFFVRRDHASKVISQLDKIVAYPSSVRESRDINGRLTFVSAEARQKLIGDLPFVNLEDGVCRDLASWGELNSDNWKQGKAVEF